MSIVSPCPNCKSEFSYSDGHLLICPECFHEWDPNQIIENIEILSDSAKVVDSNGNELSDGDSVIVIKDLPVKGSLRPVKAGTKVKNIKLVESDHNISCKIDGFGSMGLKSEFVRKA